jgi:spore coat polysaccharide biosynthesis protein SpsF
MRIVAVIQARMGSSRLPGKILMPLAGKSVLQHVLERVSIAGFAEVVTALPDRTIDDAAAQLAERLGATVVRGDEDDVLSRYLLAARSTNADAIMRITADCPLIDPDVLKAMIGVFADGSFDLVTNARIRTFPRGLDAELFTREALEIMAVEALTLPQREHVTPFLYANPERFQIHDYVAELDLSPWRLTLDTPEDLLLLTRIFELALDPDSLRLREVMAIIESYPELLNINALIEQKEI